MTSIARSFYNTDSALAAYLDRRWPVAIWTAVLKQAVKDILEGPAQWEMRGLDLHAQRKLALEMREAAQRWVDDEVNEPRRFVWVCEQLGLDPSSVRRSILFRDSQLHL